MISSKTVLFSFSILLFSFFGCQDIDHKAEIIIEEIRAEYAPDKRVALWDVEIENGVLKGETNLPAAFQDFESRLAEANIVVRNEIKMLPDEELEGMHFALVRNSVANIRSEARHSAELATQALLGTPLNVLKNVGEWYLVQTPDKYLSWVDEGGITLMNESTFNDWIKAEKVVFTGLTDYIYTDSDFKTSISDLAAGNILVKLSETARAFQVQLPDGRTGFMKKEHTANLQEWIASQEPNPEKLIFTAKSMMGAPYLWGGTSVKGMDCSGFTKTIFFMNGQIIPRDASQQINEGQLVDDSQNWESLEKGDLLFFGTPATESSKERVVHVGMWIGDMKFIHASGRVRISSFDSTDPLYDEFNLNRYLRTKRILEIPSENIIAVENVVM